MESMENGLCPIRPYTQEREYVTMRELPIIQENRVKTDKAWIIISSLFALSMFIMAIVVFKPQQLIKITYPTDQEGRHCTLDNKNYNYLYFASAKDPNKRLCVSSCPTGDQKRLNCWPTKEISCALNVEDEHEVLIYATVSQKTSIGLFCLPEDPIIKNEILHNANLVTRMQFVQTYHTIWISVLISACSGIIYLVLLRFCTNCTVFSTILFGGLGSLGMGSAFLFLKSDLSPLVQVGKIIMCILMIVLGVFILSSLVREGKDIELCVIFLNKSFNCLSEFKTIVFLIPLFLLLFIGLIGLAGFQLLSYWSSSTLNNYPNEVYDIPEGTFAVVTSIFLFIQLIWGFSFLKETFSFIVSGTTISWFFRRQHDGTYGFTNMVKFHIGSVVAGSFLLIFFYIIDVVYDIIKPSQRSNPGCYRSFTKVFNFLDRFLGLVRSDSMAYINITGVNYFTASRWCQKMCLDSELFQGSQSINRFFRISSHVLLALMGTIYSVFQLETKLQNPHVPALLFIFLLNLFVVTFFVSLPADMAQALLTCTLVEKFLQNIHLNKQNTSPKYNQYTQ